MDPFASCMLIFTLHTPTHIANDRRMPREAMQQPRELKPALLRF